MPRAVVCRVDQAPAVENVDGFEHAQKVIGGYIQRMHWRGLDLLVDEDGLLKELRKNRTAPEGYPLVGTFIVSRLDDGAPGGLASLSDEDLATVLAGLGN